MFPDFVKLLSALNARKVKYLIVGGYAVSRHAQPRATKDLDLLVQPKPRNGVALLRALVDFGAPVTGFAAKDLIEKGKFFRMGHPPVAVDILPEISGIDFDAAWKNRVSSCVDLPSGLSAHFISSDDLIAAKLASGRAQDIADVEALRLAATISTAPSKKKVRSRLTKKAGKR